jgi:hypothetical protein
MTDSRGVLREVAWREVFPWLLIFRCFRLAIHPAILTIALAAALLTPLGWRAAQYAVFWKSIPANDEELAKDLKIHVPPDLENVTDAVRGIALQEAHQQRLQARTEMWKHAAELTRLPGVGRVHDPNVLARVAQPLDALTTRSPLGFVFYRFSEPILRIYRTSTDIGSFTFYLLGTLWTLAVWGFAGGMITRIAAIELGREEQARLRSVFRLTLRRWFDFFTAPLYPILGTFLIALLTIPVGWILLSDAGTIVSGLLWIFALIGGAISALLLLWLFIGWPLMWPAISAEETGDSFEAMSRSFAYAFQRPLHYLFFAIIAALLGYVGWSVVDFVCQLALDATHWAVSWGAGHERIVDVISFPRPTNTESKALLVGSGMIRGIEGLLLALSESFAYSFFWVSATAIYLLLRHNLDRAEFDEVWLEEDADRYGLPPEEPAPAPVTTPPAATAATPAAEPAAPAEKPEIDNNQAE